MIGQLQGVVLAKSPPSLMLDVQGVGYEIEAPMSVFYVLPEVGQTIRLHTHLIVREDAQRLYGFVDENEKMTFRHLLKINGVGAKLALAILSGITLKELAQCIHDSDTGRLIRIPGIGKKTAERLIIEMRDRLKPLFQSDESIVEPLLREIGNVSVLPSEEAVSALIALGYKPQEASRMVRQVQNAKELSSENIIRAALQKAAKGK